MKRALLSPLIIAIVALATLPMMGIYTDPLDGSKFTQTLEAYFPGTHVVADVGVTVAKYLTSPAYAYVSPCEDGEGMQGWEYHPGLWDMCLLYQMQEFCGAELECWEDNWW